MNSFKDLTVSIDLTFDRYIKGKLISLNAVFDSFFKGKLIPLNAVVDRIFKGKLISLNTVFDSFFKGILIFLNAAFDRIFKGKLILILLHGVVCKFERWSNHDVQSNVHNSLMGKLKLEYGKLLSEILCNNFAKSFHLH